ncbi:MAG: DNA-directed RNA polymerase I subunit rpa49 [Phylliscum demangeonii]|nr:MAG: DNA-directed RNA polymerase I subunit rpa49 [Phylliscum demangeonii]
MADLKRKKSSLATERPKKKKRVTIIEDDDLHPDARMVKFKISANDKQNKNKNDWKPIIVSSPGISIPATVAFTPYTKSTPAPAPAAAPPPPPPPASKGRAGRSTTTDATASRVAAYMIQSSGHARMDYVGQTQGAGAAAQSLVKHYVALYDPRTGEVEMIEAQRMVVRGTIRAHDAEARAEAEKSEPVLSAWAAQNELNRVFGTLKAKKALAALADNAIVTGAGAGGGDQAPDSAALLASMEGVMARTSTRDELIAAADEAKPRPKANLLAQTPADVYTIESLVGTATMQLLVVQDWLDAAAAAGSSVTIKSRYVRRRLAKLVAASTSSTSTSTSTSRAQGGNGGNGDVTTLKVLRYLLLLINFVDALKPGGKTGRKVPFNREALQRALGVSNFLVEAVVNRFAVD